MAAFGAVSCVERIVGEGEREVDFAKAMSAMSTQSLQEKDLSVNFDREEVQK
jgi:hypothetical protein